MINFHLRFNFILQEISMDRNRGYFCFVSWYRLVIFGICLKLLKLIECVPTIYHFPNTVYFRSNEGCGPYVMKNCEAFVFGPELAMDSTPLVLCFNSSVISSLNLPPQMLLPPFPVLVGSPVCTMNDLMFLTKTQLL